MCHTYTPLAVGVQHGAGHVFGIDEETVRREAERIEGIAGVQDQILVGAGEVVGSLVLIVKDLGAGDLIGVDAVVGRDRDRRAGLGVLQVIEEGVVVPGQQNGLALAGNADAGVVLVGADAGV